MTDLGSFFLLFMLILFYFTSFTLNSTCVCFMCTIVTGCVCMRVCM